MELIKWDKIRYQIETAKDIETLTGIKNRLRAYQVLAEQSKQSQEVQAKIAIYYARAERKCGEWLKENIKQGGDRKSKLQDATLKLKDIGVDKTESYRLQKIADIPENKFENILLEAEVETKRITKNMLVNIAREAEKSERKKETPPLPEGKFNVIYADPPWKYNDKCESGAIQAGGAERHYRLMSIDELCKLDIPSDKNSVLFLWTTSPLLEECFEVINAWGFKYKSSFVWDKVKHNMGHYNSVRHEFLLVCTRGSFTPQYMKLFDSVFVEEKTKHSKKPDWFYKMIETLYPEGKYLELFARRKFNNKWTCWGDEYNEI